MFDRAEESRNGGRNPMDKIYRFLKEKIAEMHKEGKTSVSIDYAEIAQLYQMVCFFKQIQKIANGWED